MSPLNVEITDTQLIAFAEPLIERLVADRVASRITAGDASLWGPEAEPEAAVRLAWTTLHETSRPLIAEIDALAAELRADGVDRVVLAGMGGSSLAPEVITGTAGKRLIVLDTTDPAQVADALSGDLDRTVLVVSSKSGTTVETDSHRRIFEDAFAKAGVDAASRIVVVTDPGSPLHEQATESGYRKVFTANPNLGGRYSALSAFGLVPAGLAGADIGQLLDEATEAATVLAEDSPNNPALRLASVWAAAHAEGAEKLVLADTGSGITGFPDWAEQLIAESTGKNLTGMLPVVVEGPEAPGFADAGADATPVSIGPANRHTKISCTGPLGAQLLMWEYATATLGRLLHIDPFNQPDVEAAKKASRSLLNVFSSDGPAADTGTPAPSTIDGSVEVYPAPGVLTAGAGTLSEVLRTLIAAAPHEGYIAVQAYLNRIDDASAILLRSELARRTGLQTTFGWGPRFLHSTGQYHKGGERNGVFLQITGANEEDLRVPGQGYTLGNLQLAQALGDGQVLTEIGRPVLRLHLTDRLAGLSQLVGAVQELSR